MLWIQYHYKHENIPEQLFYDGYQIDKNNDDKTSLMLWIEHRPNEDIPKKLYYDGC